MEMETFETWKNEIATELDEAKQALTAATERRGAAETARDLARADQLRMRAMLDTMPQPIPTSLMMRTQPGQRALHTAEGALTLAKENVANAKRRVDDLQDAFDRLTAALAPVEPHEVAQ